MGLRPWRNANTRTAQEQALQNDSAPAEAEKQIRATHTHLAHGLQSDVDNDDTRADGLRTTRGSPGRAILTMRTIIATASTRLPPKL